MREGIGVVYIYGQHRFIRLPADVVKDSAFPFKHKQRVRVRINNKLDGLDILEVET